MTSEQWLKSIAHSMKRIADELDKREDESLADTPRRLTEPERGEYVAPKGEYFLNKDAVRRLRGASKEVSVAGETRGGLKRLTEPGEPVTGGEGEYLLPTENKVGEP